jgi:hypothetical protein
MLQTRSGGCRYFVNNLIDAPARHPVTIYRVQTEAKNKPKCQRSAHWTKPFRVTRRVDDVYIVYDVILGKSHFK